MSNKIDRRTIDETILKYQLHPELRDIFTEGLKDRRFYEWYLTATQKSKDVAFYDIDSVDVPGQLVTENGLNVGVRGRVITLAKEIDKNLDEDDCQVTFIADRDFDELLAKAHDCRVLLFTDGTSIELYLLDGDLLHRHFSIICGFTPYQTEEMLRSMEAFLRFLFILRAVNETLLLEAQLISPDKYIEITRGGLNFDSKRYLDNYINSKGLSKRSAEIIGKFAQLEAIDGSALTRIHGHIGSHY